MGAGKVKATASKELSRIIKNVFLFRIWSLLILAWLKKLSVKIRNEFLK